MFSADISPEIVEVADNLLKFMEREIMPMEADPVFRNERRAYDDDGLYVARAQELRRKARERSAELGFYTLCSDERLGGGGIGALSSSYIYEKVHEKFGPGLHLLLQVVLPLPFSTGLSPLLTFLPPETLALVQPDLAAGRKTLCFGLSEPDAGSDVLAMKTTARRDGEGWVINGSKQWITNAPYADYCMLFAVTDPEMQAARKGGITGFLVDTRQSGFQVTSVIPVLGHQGSDAGIIALDNVRVDDGFRLGPVNEGLKVAMNGVNVGRMTHGASFVGMAQWALDQAVAYSKVRKVQGKPISELGAIQAHLAECATDIYAARCMVRDCARNIDEGRASTREISIVKLFCTEMANRVFDRAIQVHGAIGLTNELRLEAGYRLARLMRIPDGSSEVQRKTIAKELLRASS